MSSITLLSDKRESGIDYLKRIVSKLEEEAVSPEEVFIIYCTSDDTVICHNEMKSRDLAFIAQKVNTFVNKLI